MEDMIPIFVVFALVSIPIVRMLINHQQKMTELLNRPTLQNDPEIAHLRDTVARLTAVTHQNAIEIDSLKTALAASRPSESATVEQRLGS